jgi:hypothetical protein
VSFESEEAVFKAMMLQILQVIRSEEQYDSAGKRIDEIGQRYVLTADPRIQMELRRRVARMALYAAINRGGSFQDVSDRFLSRCALGFLEIHSELAVLLEFAHSCGNFDQRSAGIQVLAEARNRLLENRAEILARAFDEYSEQIESCQEQLDVCGLA